MKSLHPTLPVDSAELEIRHLRASGPGGQNVNKVSTAVELRFDVGKSRLPAEVKARLLRLAGRNTAAKVLIIKARRFRTQKANRQDALERLLRMLDDAAAAPRVRRVTRPPAAVGERRLRQKRERGRVKRLRGQPIDEA